MGVLGLRSGIVKVTKHVHTRLKTNIENKRLAKEVKEAVSAAEEAGESPFEDDLRDASLQEVLAMLVDGVYFRDCNDGDLDLIVKPLLEGEYEVDVRMAHCTSKLYWTRMQSISEKDEEAARIKHYIRHPRNPNKSAPKLVIAIRGTKLSKCSDLVDDIKIAMSSLNSSSRFKQGRDLVKKIIEEYAKWQQGDDQDSSESAHRELASLSLDPPEHEGFMCDVCRICPIIGPRYISNKIEHYDLCQYCFQKHGALSDYTKIEEPLESTLSTSRSLRSATRDDIYITGHSLGAALALQIGKTLATEEGGHRYNVHCFNPPFMTIVELIEQGMFIPKAKMMLRKFTPLEPLISVASNVKNAAKATTAVLLGKKDELVWEVVHFINLTDWVPVLYINAHDRICKRFRKYYKQKQKVSSGFEVSSQALLTAVLGRRALFSSLVPSVNMRVSKKADKPHALKNWYRDPDVDKLKCRPYRLLPGLFVAGLPIHTLAEAIISDSNSVEELSALEADLDVDKELSALDAIEESDLDSDEESDLKSNEVKEETHDRVE